MPATLDYKVLRFLCLIMSRYVFFFPIFSYGGIIIKMQDFEIGFIFKLKCSDHCTMN